MKFFTHTLLSLIILPLSAFAEGFSATVDYVIDGDTFVTNNDEKVRLLGINTPEIGRNGKKSQPFALKAKQKLTQLISNKEVHLTFSDGKKKDKYGRLLAFISLKNGTDINKQMLTEGLAHVYTFPDTPFNATHFFNAENSARKAKKGIWNLPRWEIIDTQKSVSKKRIGKFQIAEGKVISSRKVRKKIYLNFGDNWRTDFTVEIPKKHWEKFEHKGINIKKHYLQKHVRIRGFLKPVNGLLVTASHPEQLEILPDTRL